MRACTGLTLFPSAMSAPEPNTSGEGPSTESGTGTIYGASFPQSGTNSGDNAAAGTQPPTPMSRSESDTTYTSSPPQQAAPFPQAGLPAGAPPITSGAAPVTSGSLVSCCACTESHTPLDCCVSPQPASRCKEGAPN